MLPYRKLMSAELKPKQFLKNRLPQRHLVQQDRRQHRHQQPTRHPLVNFLPHPHPVYPSSLKIPIQRPISHQIITYLDGPVSAPNLSRLKRPQQFVGLQVVLKRLLNKKPVFAPP